MLSIIVPAHDEQDWIGATLEALLSQDAAADEFGGVQVVVAANGCSDGTVVAARAFEAPFEAKGWTLKVLDLERGGKTHAMNEADRVAGDGPRVYMDADVICSESLIGQLGRAVSVAQPRYASGWLVPSPSSSWVTRCFAKVWLKVPFMRTNVPGTGVCAVSAAGRARWADLPEVTADDSFIRLSFAPDERVLVPATFRTPLAEGLARLVKVRRRQDRGSRELSEAYPEMLANESKPAMRWADYVRLFLGQPICFVVYVFVVLVVRCGPDRDGRAWSRGR